MNVLTSDFEVTTSNKGNPFDQTNKAVCLGLKDNDEDAWCDFTLDSSIQNYCNPDVWDLYVFFNAKFDLHWYRRLGFKLPNKIWCCQVAEFLLSGQKERYPSLDATAQRYGLGTKEDEVKLHYWDKGIDTDAIPQDILSTYCCQDVSLTYQIYLKQLEQFKAQPKLYKLFKLMCQDLLVLEEMEWNGLVYDKQLCEERSINIGKEIAAIQEQLHHVYPELAINFGSGDQLSAWLYGGSIYSEDKEHIGFFKTGAHKGEPKYKNVIRETVLPRLVEPLKNSELKKEGYYATDEATLQKLKGPAAKKYVGPLLKLAELQKLDSTYYKGLPKKAKEMNWPEGKIHGQFNQVVAQTGRLSSSQPNLQNFSGDCLDIFITRFD